MPCDTFPARHLTPADRVALFDRINNIDAEGAAAELVRMLGLGRNAEDVITAIIEEAQAQAYAEGWLDHEAGNVNRVAVYGSY